jgi:hypothetical protein
MDFASSVMSASGIRFGVWVEEKGLASFLASPQSQAMLCSNFTTRIFFGS